MLERTDVKRGPAARWACLALAACLAVAGCGDDSGDGGSGGGQGASEAAAQQIEGTPHDVAERVAATVAKARKRKDCEPVELANQSALVDVVCPGPPILRKSLAKFDVTRSAVYGTGAVVDYKSGQAPDGASVLLFVSPKREWAIGRFGILAGPTVNTKDSKSRASFDEAVTGYLRGVRERDCKVYDRFTDNLYADTKAVCSRELPATQALATGLRADPGARPDYLGGNANFGFYGLALTQPSPTYRTIGVVKASKDAPVPFQVMIDAPGPPPAGAPSDGEVREVVRESIE